MPRTPPFIHPHLVPPPTTISSTHDLRVASSTPPPPPHANGVAASPPKLADPRRTSVDDAPLQVLYKARIRPWLDAVDHVRALLRDDHQDIKLPTIVVVGDQSSGKTSVIEALSGVELPRGEHITTRCPLVMRMVSCADASQAMTWISTEVYTTERPGETIKSSADIPARVEHYTKQLAGSSVNVCAHPIYLTVVRPHAPDLTLVDLPGLTCNPIGDQPKDIHAQLVKLIDHYIKSEATVILAVLPATVDFATCQCIQLAKQVDPQGSRTLAVVTKSDTAEVGFQAKLEHAIDVFQFQMGLVAVRNRSKEETDRGVTWVQSREAERQFFQRTSSSTLIGWGTDALATLLVRIQEEKLRSMLPRVMAQLKQILTNAQEDLQKMPPSCHTLNECRLRMEPLLHAYFQTLASLVRGDYAPAEDKEEYYVKTALYRMAIKYQHTLHEVSAQYLTREFAEQVYRAVHQHSGINLPNVVAPQVFDNLVYSQLDVIRQPTFQLLHSTCQYMEKVLVFFLKQTFVSVPNLGTRLQEILVQWLHRQADRTEKKLYELIDAERSIFTINPYYTHVGQHLKQILRSPPDPPVTSKATTTATTGTTSTLSSLTETIGSFFQHSDGDVQFQVADVVVRFNFQDMTLDQKDGWSPLHDTVLDLQVDCLAYMQVVHKRLSDCVPMQLQFHLVQPMCTSTPASSTTTSNDPLFTHLRNEVQQWRDEQLIDLMQEPVTLTQTREKLKTTITNITAALAVLHKLPGGL